MAIKFKEGVIVDGIRPITIAGIHEVAKIYEGLGLDLTITSVFDGVHSANSLHYHGLAFDCRIWDIPKEALPFVVDRIAEVLGPDWDVVWHPVNHKTHIHVEYDPD